MQRESRKTVTLVREAMALPNLASLPDAGGGVLPPGLIYC
jgi:hypothetical protein